MPPPTEETTDADVTMETSTGVKLGEMESVQTAGENGDAPHPDISNPDTEHSDSALKVDILARTETGSDQPQSGGSVSPEVNIDVQNVSVAMRVKKTDQTATDGQTLSCARAEEADQLSVLPMTRGNGATAGVNDDKRKSLMLWVDPDLVQTVRTEQTRSPQHSPENIPGDPKRLKKVVRKERWASETEHEVRKEVWKKMCLHNGAGASVANVYSEVEEGLFGKGNDKPEPDSITLPSFVDPDHSGACYALKSEGRTRLNRVLCVLADTRPDILYCPILAPIASLLLHYMDPEETFDCLSALLTSERYKYLEISWVGYEAFRMSFEKLAARFAASAHKMLAKQGDPVEIYRDWVWWILEDLPFSHVIRVMDCYLSEGLKIFYRVGLALLMLYKKYRGRVDTPDGVAASIREFVRTIPVAPNALLTVGFQFRGLSRSVIGAYQTKRKQTLRENSSPSHRTALQQNDVPTTLSSIKSSIVNHQQLQTLWSWLPSRFTIYQPSIVFTTQEHGFSLTTFYTRCEYCEPTILLIKTVDQEIFGAYLSRSWSTRNDGDNKAIYFGTGESFMFSLTPQEKKYPWMGVNRGGGDGEKQDGEEKKICEMFMRASPGLIAVGGGDGDGILLEGDLTKGFSSSCQTFDNPPLAKERSYICEVIEVITMQDAMNATDGTI